MADNAERWVAILGLGAFGQFLTHALVRSGVHVVAVDKDRANVDAIAEIADKAVIGDLTDPTVLSQAGVAECDRVVIAIGENTEGSIITALNLTEMGVVSIHARAMSDVHQQILTKLGVSTLINPEREAAERLAAEISPRGVESLASLEDGYMFAEVDAPAFSFDKTLAELDLRHRFDVLLVGVRRMEETASAEGAAITFSTFQLPDGTTTVRERDRLLLVGQRGAIERLVNGRERTA